LGRVQDKCTQWELMFHKASFSDLFLTLPSLPRQRDSGSIFSKTYSPRDLCLSAREAVSAKESELGVWSKENWSGRWPNEFVKHHELNHFWESLMFISILKALKHPTAETSD
jgi:hypothetical protein